MTTSRPSKHISLLRGAVVGSLLLTAGGSVASPTREGASPESVSEPKHTDSNYWAEGEERSFVSALVWLGAYSEGQVGLGYGRPHDLWGGISAHVMGYPGMGALAIGPRLDLLLVNLNVRVRRTWTTSSSSPRSASYSDESFFAGAEGGTAYTSLDADLWGFIPVGRTLGIWSVRSVWAPWLPPERAVYSAMIRYPLEDSPLIMLQLIWGASLAQERLFVGPAADVSTTFRRDPLVRIGGAASYAMGPHSSLDFLLTAPVSSPDQISWVQEVWGNINLTLLWASGEARPFTW